MRVFLAALGAAIVFAAAGASAQQQDRTAQVRSYLESGMAVHSGIGYSRDRYTPDIVVPLRLDHPFLWPVYLTRGQTYRAYGACDDNCSDIDMEIYDADGNLADRDVAANDTPYVQITPTQTGRAYVRVWLYACRSESCFVGLRLVSGGTAAPRPGERVRESDIAHSQEEADQRAVRAQLEAQGAAHEQAGYRQSGDDLFEQLPRNDEGHSWTLHLQGGVTYLFQAACDQQCNNADMEIRNSAGERIASDINGDAIPVVTITPPHAGDYALRIWLRQCAREPCAVGFRTYRRVTN
ncbi:MAG: hypothetical protein JSS00_07055 [Proteobacteria bacterium]|nr:hypothetical protein [Pseudomonadota bacterium]